MLHRRIEPLVVDPVVMAEVEAVVAMEVDGEVDGAITTTTATSIKVSA